MPFDIGDVYINGAKQNIDLTKTEIITIPKRGTYTINLSVPQVYDKKLTQKNVFKKGRYRFALYLGLTSWTNSNDVFYDSVNIDLPGMIVEYGL